MKLMTKEIERKLDKVGLYGNDQGFDSEVIVKYFNPIGPGTWLVTSGERLPDGDWELYGYAEITDGEWGYTFLSQLEEIKLQFGMTIERDLHIKEGATVAEVCLNSGMELPDYYYEEKIAKKCYEIYKEQWCEARNVKVEDFNEEIGANGECYAGFDEFRDNEFYDVEMMRILLDEDMMSQWKGYVDFDAMNDKEKYPELSENKDFSILLVNLNENELEKIEYNLSLYNYKNDIEEVDEGGRLVMRSKSFDERFNPDIIAWYEGEMSVRNLMLNVFGKERLKTDVIKVGIMQLGKDEANHNRKFISLRQLKKWMNEEPNVNNYELIYVDHKIGDKYNITGFMNDVYRELNDGTPHPDNYYGYSLSMGDVIVIGDEKTGKAIESYYVDDFGFTKLEGFLEDDDKGHMKEKFFREIDVYEELKMCRAVLSDDYNDGFVPEYMMDKDYVNARLEILKNYKGAIELAERRSQHRSLDKKIQSCRHSQRDLLSDSDKKHKDVER